jgi:hypothetical protein
MLDKSIRGRIVFPTDLFEIFDEFLATRIDKHPLLAGIVSQHRVDAVTPSFPRGFALGSWNLAV